jgi:dipeptidyl aminopeptidase/acylaminoacyl peptidase
MRRKIFQTVFILLAIAVKVFSQNFLLPEELWKIERVENFVVSPDMKYAVFQSTKYDIEKNKGNTDLNLLDLTSGRIKKLTTNPEGDSNPKWAADSRTIYFVSKRYEDKKSSLYKITIDGGEAEKILEMPEAITNINLAKEKDNLIFFTSRALLEFEDNIALMKKEIEKKKEKKITAIVTEDRLYRYWDRWIADNLILRLFVYDIERKDTINLLKNYKKIPSASNSISYVISNDGKYVALALNSTEPPYDSLNTDVYILDLSSLELKNLTSENKADDIPVYFSKDGKYLFYAKQKDPTYYADNVHLTRYNLTTCEKKVLTEAYDFSFSNFQFNDDESKVYMLAEDKARSSIFEFDLKSEKLNKLFTGGTIQNLVLAKNKLYFLMSSLKMPDEIFEFDLKTKKAKQLTFINEELLKNKIFGKIEDITYKGAANEDVQMFLIYPPNYEEGKKYPLIHLIHGGPHGAFMDEFHYRWNAQAIASAGYFVAMVNFHGSTGFGLSFGKSIMGAHSEKPSEDILKATDYLIEHYSIDPKKIGAAGGSYGGYLVNWLAGTTDKFAAYISHAGVYNLMGQFASDVTHNREYSYGGAPWQNKYEQINKHNPAFNAHNFKYPMLVIHGEKDYRVPVTQGLELYGILKGKGVPAKLIYFPDENHWILTPQNSIFWYKEFINWFDKYLK